MAIQEPRSCLAHNITLHRQQRIHVVGGPLSLPTMLILPSFLKALYHQSMKWHFIVMTLDCHDIILNPETMVGTSREIKMFKIVW